MGYGGILSRGRMQSFVDLYQGEIILFYKFVENCISAYGTWHCQYTHQAPLSSAKTLLSVLPHFMTFLINGLVRVVFQDYQAPLSSAKTCQQCCHTSKLFALLEQLSTYVVQQQYQALYPYAVPLCRVHLFPCDAPHRQ